MADVSHELDALRFVVDSPLSSKVAMFNKQTQQHQQSQLLNPFSTNSGRSSPKPSFSKDEYGKPLAGSLTEMRGQKANMHVMREMLELCQIINSEGYDVKDEPKMRVIPFGELFNIYNYISDKVVGILLRARKHKLVVFEGEMLFQRRDDDVPIFLIKPIAEIRQELNAKIEEIKRAGSPAPQATSLILDKSAHKQKLASRSSTPSLSPAPSKQATPAQSKASSPVRSNAAVAAAGGVGVGLEMALGATQKQPANGNQNIQPTPELTLTTAPDMQQQYFHGQIIRLEGGQEAQIPPKRPEIDNTPTDVVNATETETLTEPTGNQLATTPTLEAVIAENAGVPLAVSNSVDNVADIPANVIDANVTLTAQTETITTAPTLVEASAEAAIKETSMSTPNSNENPQA